VVSTDLPGHTHSLRWNPPEGQAVKKQGVYLLHGTGEHADRYEHLAQRLSGAGYRVGAHDHPGHGRSSGKRGVFDPPGELATQAAIQCQRFAAETGCAPVLFGHSLGGVSRLTHDENIRTKAEADPLNHGFKSASLVQWLIRSGARQLANASELDTDTLLLIAGDDPVVNSARTREFADLMANERLTLHEYDGYFHEILNETPERAERVFTDILQWVSLHFTEVCDF